MPDTPLNPDALEAAKTAFDHAMGIGRDDYEEPWYMQAPIKYRNIGVEPTIRAYLAAALPEVTSVEELDQLPVGAVVYASNHIGPAERFDVGWMGCGNNAAWSSALLARDGLPARVLYRPEVKP